MPSERFAYSSVRSFGARKAGWRSGSSMQNMKRARHAVAVHAPLELLVDPVHAVDVVPEVDVRVEDLGVAGNGSTQLVVVARDQLLGPLELTLHET